MDLPTLQSGMAILADQINQISREVRANAITAFTGGQFQRTSGGTSIQIDPKFFPGSGGSTTQCPFFVSDSSQQGGVRVMVSQHTVSTPDVRWPQGMGIDYPPFYLTLTDSSYIYIKYVYVDNDVIVKPDEDAITIAHDNTPIPNTVNEEYALIAVVTIADGKITKITNSCPVAYPQPCRLSWSAPPEPPPETP